MYAVIMAGGSGTRFWPHSREKMPKQLLKIGGDDTLIQQTVERVWPLIPRERIFIVTHEGLADDIVSQLTTRFGGSWKENIILEPTARNTAPALGLSALHIARTDPEGIMVVLAADHYIRKTDNFLTSIQQSVRAAEKDYLVTLGIKPDRPDTGYGYIQAGESIPILEDSRSMFKVTSFVEKPDLELAKSYIESGNYFWNSGMFIWKAGTFINEIERLRPELYQGLMEIQKSIGTDRLSEVATEVFDKVVPISVDCAVMEKTDRALVIPVDIGWSDVGCWAALEQITDKDDSGNIVTGNVIDIESQGSIICAEKRLVATIGLKDIIVVDTPDATLVCSKERAQDVKKVVYELKRRKAPEYHTHLTVHRPWGNYTVLEEGERYKIKRIVVNPGAKLSHQLHYHRSEHWAVLTGTARVTNGEKEYDVHPNESTYIPMSTKHRLENRGKIPLQIIEIQNGEYLEEDDIVRFADDYKRHETAKRNLLPELPKQGKVDIVTHGS